MPLDQATMLAQVMDPQVQAVSYTLIDSGDKSIGFIAEDMINVVPESVTLNEEGAPQGTNLQRAGADSVGCRARAE